jgi:hypothetical protein
VLAPQPDPGHVIHSGQASVSPVMDSMPVPLIAAGPGHVHCDGQASVPLDAVPPTPLPAAADASIASKVVVPYCGPMTVISTTGDAYCALQPSSVQYALVQTSQPAPMHAPTASIASQVVDPYCGRTKVVATTGGAYCARSPT